MIRIDPYLAPHREALDRRLERFLNKKRELIGDGSLTDFANGHKYFGFHRTKTGWVYREWAPAAEELYLTGDFCGWDTRSHPMTRLANGVFEIELDAPARRKAADDRHP